MIKNWLSIGALRIMLHSLAFLLMLVLPFAEPSWSPQGIQLLLGAVVPALAPMVCIVIMLDVMMSKIYQSDTTDEAVKQHFQMIIRFHLVITVLLFVFWLEAFSSALF